MQMKFILPFTLLLFLAAGCKVSKIVETDLYFGFSMPNNNEVSDTAWQRFMNQEISPVFTHGFTVLPAQGKWRNTDNQLISEKSAVVVCVNKMDKTLNRQIDTIRAHYRKQFSQESVMRVDIPVKKWKL